MDAGITALAVADAQSGCEPSEERADPSREELSTGELHALDAYSRVVVSAVELAGPAVVSVHVGRPSQESLVAAGSGSGVIVTPDGYLLTNQHVVHRATAVEVGLITGDRVPAAVIAQDASTDLAVLHARTGALPALSLAARPAPRVGQLVVAIGNPFGFEATVSAGVVSAYLGVAGRTRRLDRRLVRALGLVAESGLEVMAREPDTPASRSDLRVGDIIVTAQSQPIGGVDALHRFLSRWHIGESLQLQLLRRTQLLSIEIRPIEMPPR